jgi:hypothetical protein
MIVEHLVSIGRRSALERTAHFFMELAERLSLVGEATETEFKCPLSQFVLADALGHPPIPQKSATIGCSRFDWRELSSGAKKSKTFGFICARATKSNR